MLAIILATVMASRGVPTLTIENTVYLQNRAGCIVQALHGDPTLPVVVCQ